MIPVSSRTRTGAWRKVARLLLEKEPRLNVIARIKNPTAILSPGPIDEELDRQLIEAGRGHEITSIVAENTFPQQHYLRDGARGVYETYPNETYPDLRRKGGWGTYAHRMAVGAGYSPLGHLVSKLQQEASYPGGKRACFELGIYRNDTDRGRRMGAPCLAHLSFKMYEGRVYLTALYRSHDFYSKALANYLSLSQLLAFVADQSGLKPGELVVHSTFAGFHRATKKDLMSLFTSTGDGSRIPSSFIPGQWKGTDMLTQANILELHQTLDPEAKKVRTKAGQVAGLAEILKERKIDLDVTALQSMSMEDASEAVAMTIPDDLKREPDDLKREPDDLKREPDDLKREPDDLKREPDDLKRGTTSSASPTTPGRVARRNTRPSSALPPRPSRRTARTGKTAASPARTGKTATSPARTGRRTSPARTGRRTSPARTGRRTSPARTGRRTSPARTGRRTSPPRSPAAPACAASVPSTSGSAPTSRSRKTPTATGRRATRTSRS